MLPPAAFQVRVDWENLLSSTPSLNPRSAANRCSQVLKSGSPKQLRSSPLLTVSLTKKSRRWARGEMKILRTRQPGEKTIFLGSLGQQVLKTVRFLSTSLLLQVHLGRDFLRVVHLRVVHFKSSLSYFVSDIEEKGVRMKLTVIDTPGFGDHINNENW